MARVICNYLDCVFNEEGICTSESIEIDMESGCLTYSPSGSLNKTLNDDTLADQDDDVEPAAWGEYGYEEKSIYDSADDEDKDWDVDDDV